MVILKCSWVGEKWEGDIICKPDKKRWTTAIRHGEIRKHTSII